MFAALLGVASFHRACLLAQDFTHEPACQTGERAPQGRFRHQPEQMVYPPFAWQLASFPSLPVCGEEAPYCPLRDFATLRTYSPEIKAQQAIFDLPPVYPELVGVIGSRVPDYQGRFLRGVSSGHSIGQTVANSITSHNHTQPTHTHSFSGTGRVFGENGGPRLQGDIPTWIWRANQLPLRYCWALEHGARRAARGWNTRNMGRAFLSAPKPRWRSGSVRFTGLLE